MEQRLEGLDSCGETEREEEDEGGEGAHHLHPLPAEGVDEALLPLPSGDAGHDEGEAVVDVLVDQDQQGDAVGQLGKDKLGHGDDDGEDHDEDELGAGDVPGY